MVESLCDPKVGIVFLKSELKKSPTHLSKQALSSKEGVRWECSQCGWESAPMYFGEVFEPTHLCLNDSCKCGHCRSEHEHVNLRDIGASL